MEGFQEDEGLMDDLPAFEEAEGDVDHHHIQKLDDPTAELRAKQLSEYKKLCRDLKIKEHTAISLRFSDNNGAEDPHEYDFSHTYLGDKQILPLAAALAFDKQLTLLNLAQTGLRDSGLKMLCQQLKRSPRLEYMDLAENRFSLEGATALLEMVKGSPRVICIRMVDTCLDEEFRTKRGLSCQYAKIHFTLQRIFEERAQKDSAASLGSAAQKDLVAGIVGPVAGDTA